MNARPTLHANGVRSRSRSRSRIRSRDARHPIRLLRGLGAATASLLLLSAMTGCGHGSAAASEARAAEDAEFAAFLRMLSEERRSSPGGDREGDGADAGTSRSAEPAALAITIERPVDFAAGHQDPPADATPLDRLRPEEVLLSFAMYAEAGRWDDQWPLLSEPSRRAWLERVRREARRVGMEGVESRLAGADARWLWGRGFAAGGAHVDLAVRWRTRVSERLAVVQVSRGRETLDEIPLVHEDGGWRLDLVSRIERGATVRGAEDALAAD